jgi:ssDNA-binding Zn-finger/Zn-ribbon topoisomerase 1
MKSTGKCPKCDGMHIISDAKISKGGDRSMIPFFSWSKFFIDVYLCPECGFMEEYISKKDLDDQAKMTKLKENWK